MSKEGVWKPSYNWIVVLWPILYTVLTRLERLVSLTNPCG
jgi:hypothetical protein